MKPRFCAIASRLYIYDVNLCVACSHTVLLRSRSAREGGCTAKPSKPNQNISPCIEDESYRDRLSSFPYYESSSSRTRSFSMLAAPSRKGKRKHERMERVPSIDIVNNRRQFLYDIRATYWDETLVDLFAFTSVVSRMHRTGNEREKKCLAMPRQSSIKATAIVAASFPPFFSFLVIGFILLIVVGQDMHEASQKYNIILIINQN